MKRKRRESLPLKRKKSRASPELARTHYGCKNEFSRLAKQYRPFLVDGVMEEWAALLRWNTSDADCVDALLSCGDASAIVEVAVVEVDGVVAGDASSYRPAKCSFAEFVGLFAAERHKSCCRYGLFQCPIISEDKASEVLPGLLQDIEIPDVVPTELSSANFWMCIGGSSSGTHFDAHNNLLCVVRGSKTVRLFPPTATGNLYPQDVSRISSNHSQVPALRPNLTTFPRYPEALALSIEVTVPKGSSLFIPEGWWHQVDSTDVTIAVNFWWKGEALLLLRHPSMAPFLLRTFCCSLVESARREELRLLLGRTAECEHAPLSSSTFEDVLVGSAASSKRFVVVLSSLSPQDAVKGLCSLAKHSPLPLRVMLSRLRGVELEVFCSKMEEAQSVCHMDSAYDRIFSVFGDERDEAATSMLQRRDQYASRVLERVLRDNLTPAACLQRKGERE